ncbi:unnamed protein product [Pleuronectes platessa]|uniref:Ig-like domain-containing protein n=1 Tax=Pleuronectes platessa TaxID=8262 RepID=A0A9N7TTR6_PLEPL|nr:unnamed protein product [Pleuronectes platessa]
MDEIKRIEMSLHLLLVLIPFTVPPEHYSIIIRAGAEVTLPCDNVRDDHVNCGATDWFSTDSDVNGRANLFVDGELDTSKISKSKADRLRLAANCALVISEVTAEDADHYHCRQSYMTTHEDHVVYLSVVNVTEQKRTDEIQGGDVAVAFSTVEAPSSSTGPSADPSSLYANVTVIQ